MLRRFLVYGWLVGLAAGIAPPSLGQDDSGLGPGYLDAFAEPPSPKHSPRERKSVDLQQPISVEAQQPISVAKDAFAIEQQTNAPAPMLDVTTNGPADLAPPTPPVELDTFDIAPPEDAGPKCDKEKCKALAKAVAGSHKVVYWRNNFDYLCDPCYRGWHLGEDLKRRGIGCYTTLDIGGSYRARYHNERNMRGLGLTGVDDTFLLHQTRLYGNLEIGKRFRAYAEMIDAVSNYEDFGPRGIEENRSDLLNLFADFVLYEDCCGDGELTGRVGRQELIYGDQRLVSPLPWANTRRTFEGASLLWKGKDWDTDAFWTRPVVNNTNQFDQADQSREFMGVYSTYKGFEDEKLDLYFLRFEENDGAGFDYNTFGARYAGSRCEWLWDSEVAYQTGDVGAASQDAWMVTFGLGRNFKCAPWKPQLWAYYDFASGDDNGNGFHHLFPLGHKYLGFMDLFGRRNIEDFNVRLTASPTDKLKLLMWWHVFHLQNSADVPYNVNMTPFVGTAGGSSYLGQELDITASYKLGPQTNVLVGYSHFFQGDFYATNPSPAPIDDDADFYYVQFTQNF